MPRRVILLAILLAAACVGARAGGQSTTTPKAHRRAARSRAPKPASKLAINPDRVNDASLVDPVGRRSRGDAVLRAQVLLDRAKFSCGEINAIYSENLRKAIAAFQKVRGLPQTGKVEAETWAALDADSAPVLASYTIAAEDVTGPFAKVPLAMMAKAKLEILNYESALEGLAEKFHSSPGLMRMLNTGKSFDQAGEQILVTQVSTPVPGKAASVVVDGSERSVTALDESGKVLAYYPATVGSEHDPLPVGTWKILGKRYNPKFYYSPELFWNAGEKDSKTIIAAGPRNPVGVVWITLSKEHYGIHGTPVPSQIGRTESHGCIRLTNWNATELAAMVGPGVKAILEESKPSTAESAPPSSH